MCCLGAVLNGKLATASKKMPQKAGDDIFLGLHFKFVFVKLKPSLKITRSATVQVAMCAIKPNK